MTQAEPDAAALHCDRGLDALDAILWRRLSLRPRRKLCGKCPAEPCPWKPGVPRAAGVPFP